MCCQSSPLLYGVHGAITTEKEGERSFNVSENTVFSLLVLHFSSHTFLFQYLYFSINISIRRRIHLHEFNAAETSWGREGNSLILGPRGVIFLNFQKLCCSLVMSGHSILFMPLVLGLVMNLGQSG